MARFFVPTARAVALGLALAAVGTVLVARTHVVSELLAEASG